MQDEPNPFATFPTFAPEAPASAPAEGGDDHTTTSRKRKGRTPKAANDNNPPQVGKRRGRPPAAEKPKTVTEAPARRLAQPTYDLAFVQLVLEAGIAATHLEMFAQILTAVRGLDRRQQTAMLNGLQAALSGAK